jgi:hypothetical protein
MCSHGAQRRGRSRWSRRREERATHLDARTPYFATPPPPPPPSLKNDVQAEHGRWIHSMHCLPHPTQLKRLLNTPFDLPPKDIVKKSVGFLPKTTLRLRETHQPPTSTTNRATRHYDAERIVHARSKDFAKWDRYVHSPPSSGTTTHAVAQLGGQPCSSWLFSHAQDSRSAPACVRIRLRTIVSNALLPAQVNA